MEITVQSDVVFTQTFLQTEIGWSVCNFSPAIGARNQVGIGLAYRPASPCSLATQFQTRFLESIPAGLKFSTLLASAFPSLIFVLSVSLTGILRASRARIFKL